MSSNRFRSVMIVGAFLVACGLLAWPGTAAARGGGSIVFRHGSGYFGRGQAVFFPGTLFRHRLGTRHYVRPQYRSTHRHRFGRGRDCDVGPLFRHRLRFGLRQKRHHGAFDHGHNVLIFRR